jgi:DNA polymerase elongation subunit (family B)
MKIDKTEIIHEISSFLEGRNNDVKYIVNVETDSRTNYAACVIHAPDGHRIEHIQYTPFIYIKDLKEIGYQLFNGNRLIQVDKMNLYGIDIKKMKTKNHERLKKGYCWKVTSTKSSKAIYDFFKDGGLDLREKLKDENGRLLRDDRNRPIYKFSDLYYSVSLKEQFFISTGIRLFKGMKKYNDVHKLTFDIETTGLRYQHTRVFAIGVRDNRGFEKILRVKKENDDESEKRLIQDFFNTIDYVKPAIITGYHSEDFDFEYLLGRAKILNLDVNLLPTSLNEEESKRNLYRREESTLKVGQSTEYYTSTNMWGYTIIDTQHATKRAKAIDSDIKNTKLKYIAKISKVAKLNRMYVDGEDGKIGQYYRENKYFIINPENNQYLQIPDHSQKTAEELYKLIILIFC